MERNLAKMADFFRTGPTRLRPHYKNHKCPALARRQMEAGAIGMTCATLAEAEALVANGIDNVLISSEVAGDRKIRRFIELARQASVIAARRRESCSRDCCRGPRKGLPHWRRGGCRRGVEANRYPARGTNAGTGANGAGRRAAVARADGL